MDGRWHRGEKDGAGDGTGKAVARHRSGPPAHRPGPPARGPEPPARGIRRRDLGPLAVVSAVLPAALTAACGIGERTARPAVERTTLPAPDTSGGMALTQALARRRSVRAFTGEPLGREQIGQLLWAAQGVTHGPGFRTAPSAGALYPLEIYVATRSASLHYLPDGHAVEEWPPAQQWQALVDATPSTQPVQQAAAAFVIAGVVRRTAAKYGGRSRTYVDLEAGHVAQNLALRATSLGLGAVTIGAFNGDRLARYFAMPTGYTPLYLIPAGHPAE